MENDPRSDAITKEDPTFAPAHVETGETELHADPEAEIGIPVTIEELEKRTDYGS